MWCSYTISVRKHLLLDRGFTILGYHMIDFREVEGFRVKVEILRHKVSTFAFAQALEAFWLYSGHSSINQIRERLYITCRSQHIPFSFPFVSLVPRSCRIRCSCLPIATSSYSSIYRRPLRRDHSWWRPSTSSLGLLLVALHVPRTLGPVTLKGWFTGLLRIFSYHLRSCSEFNRGCIHYSPYIPFSYPFLRVHLHAHLDVIIFAARSCGSCALPSPMAQHSPPRRKADLTIVL